MGKQSFVSLFHPLSSELLLDYCTGELCHCLSEWKGIYLTFKGYLMEKCINICTGRVLCDAQRTHRHRSHFIRCFLFVVLQNESDESRNLRLVVPVADMRQIGNPYKIFKWNSQKENILKVGG